MTANKIELELKFNASRGMRTSREFAKPRRHPINDGITRYNFFDNFA